MFRYPTTIRMISHACRCLPSMIMPFGQLYIQQMTSQLEKLSHCKDKIRELGVGHIRSFTCSTYVPVRLQSLLMDWMLKNFKSCNLDQLGKQGATEEHNWDALGNMSNI